MRLSSTELRERASELNELLDPCRLCPRRCSSRRKSGDPGFCGATGSVEVSSCGPHFGEESVLVGRGGSGTVFFSHCNLRCDFCQNYAISQLGHGRTCSTHALAAAMLELAKRGCSNINLVTPTHYVPQIVAALGDAQEMGLSLPVVYNCGGYESVETLRLLDGVVDIFMPDAKYADPDAARQLSQAEDYPTVLADALREMQRQVGDLEVDSRGLARRGLLIRHLVMPGNIAGTDAVLELIAREISGTAAVNVMGQYRPQYRVVGRPGPLGRSLRIEEHEEALAKARSLGLTVLTS